MTDVHPTALVEPGAKLGPGCRVGPYCVVGGEVELGADCHLEAHVVVSGATTLGARNRAHPFAVLGGLPQRRAPHDEMAGGRLLIGDDNVFREHVTVHLGDVTQIGSRCLLMAGVHVAHDVRVGNDVTLANLVQLAGHVVVDDHVVMGGMAGVAQRVHVGESAFVAAGAMVEHDVPPCVIVQGDRARVRAVNQVGLKRRGLAVELRRAIQREFRRVYVAHGATPQPPAPEHPLVRAFFTYHAPRAVTC